MKCKKGLEGIIKLVACTILRYDIVNLSTVKSTSHIDPLGKRKIVVNLHYEEEMRNNPNEVKALHSFKNHRLNGKIQCKKSKIKSLSEKYCY
uniref:Uncharacterized protein n=1 Tax=Glossina palpalis gambiensis TaxID=67801 RepID=A0A1B0AP59_9MUSC